MVNETIKTENGEIIHDFRSHKLKWGWNGLNFTANEDRKTAVMQGVGNGIKEGNYIALTQNEKDFAYLVEEIKYDTNPSDLFTAKLRISGTIEE